MLFSALEGTEVGVRLQESGKPIVGYIPFKALLGYALYIPSALSHVLYVRAFTLKHTRSELRQLVPP